MTVPTYYSQINKMAAEIERLQTENWQLRQACGYPIPADKETPQNPFKCGICDARPDNPLKAYTVEQLRYEVAWRLANSSGDRKSEA